MVALMVCSGSLLLEHWGFDKNGAGTSSARTRVLSCLSSVK
jgi:hypothetical protein